jgi:hypothetical protein
MKDYTGLFARQLELCMAALDMTSTPEAREMMKEETAALLEEFRLENESIFQYDNKDFTLKPGAFVVPVGDHYFHSGCGAYTGAIVVSVSPFIMVSEGADMRWSQVSPEKVKVVGQVTEYALKKCLRRLEK